MFSLPLLFFILEDSCLAVCLPPSKGLFCPVPHTTVLLEELGEAGSHALPRSGTVNLGVHVAWGWAATPHSWVWTWPAHHTVQSRKPMWGLYPLGRGGGLVQESRAQMELCGIRYQAGTMLPRR